MTTPPLLTLPQVAQRLGVHRNTVNKLIRQGDLTIVKVGRLTKVRESDLAEYISRQSVTRGGAA